MMTNTLMDHIEMQKSDLQCKHAKKLNINIIKQHTLEGNTKKLDVKEKE